MAVVPGNKLLPGAFGIALLSVSAFFVAVIASLVSTEVMPAIENGSLDVETSTRVLNILWEGNEIYALLAAYALLAVGFAYAGIRAFRTAIRK